jgi:hypothetical protein
VTSAAGGPGAEVRRLEEALRVVVDRIEALASATPPWGEELASGDYAAEHAALAVRIDELHTAAGRLAGGHTA